VPGQDPTTTLTSEFHEEFASHTQQLLQRRVLWFSGALAVVHLVYWLFSVGTGLIARGVTEKLTEALLTPGREAPSTGVQWWVWGLGLVNFAIAGACFLTVRRGHLSLARLVKLSHVLVIADGVIRISLDWLSARGSLGLAGFTLTHLMACAILPWSPIQSLRPLLPVLGLHTVLLLSLSKQDLAIKVWLVAISPLVGVPGFLICLLRDSRRAAHFKLRFFQHRYGQVKRELVDARRIHESLFPRPVSSGPLRLAYAYEPMRQIGGDYLFASMEEPGEKGPGSCSMVVMDVTGHGIIAALTVNRLYGELSRIYAENPGVRPGEVLRLLNRYTHLTLACHSVFVTAFCARADMADGVLEYASGGHPPAFLRTVDGRFSDLESTAFVLGACPDEAFDPDSKRVQFLPGDSLIVYTDGAFECRNGRGSMLGIRSLRAACVGMARVEPGEWPERVLGVVTGHRTGAPTDDTLVVELSRPLVSRVMTHAWLGATPAKDTHEVRI
jgi:serine phosphatase RsbU (regulator of sigma subunit)